MTNRESYALWWRHSCSLHNYVSPQTSIVNLHAWRTAVRIWWIVDGMFQVKLFRVGFQHVCTWRDGQGGRFSTKQAKRIMLSFVSVPRVLFLPGERGSQLAFAAHLSRGGRQRPSYEESTTVVLALTKSPRHSKAVPPESPRPSRLQQRTHRGRVFRPTRAILSLQLRPTSVVRDDRPHGLPASECHCPGGRCGTFKFIRDPRVLVTNNRQHYCDKTSNKQLLAFVGWPAAVKGEGYRNRCQAELVEGERGQSSIAMGRILIVDFHLGDDKGVADAANVLCRRCV